MPADPLEKFKSLSDDATAGEPSASSFQVYVGGKRFAHTGMGQNPTPVALDNAALIVAAVRLHRALADDTIIEEMAAIALNGRGSFGWTPGEIATAIRALMVGKGMG